MTAATPAIPASGGNTVSVPVNTIPSSSPPKVAEVEQLSHLIVNHVRGSPLTWSNQLATLARMHSQDMIKRGFFDHTNPDGLSVSGRATLAGVNYTIIGENIGMVPLGNVIGCGIVQDSDAVAECATEGWINSPGHYANIMNGAYTETGIGVAWDGSTFYLTQVFR